MILYIKKEISYVYHKSFPQIHHYSCIQKLLSKFHERILANEYIPHKTARSCTKQYEISSWLCDIVIICDQRDFFHVVVSLTYHPTSQVQTNGFEHFPFTQVLLFTPQRGVLHIDEEFVHPGRQRTFPLSSQ